MVCGTSFALEKICSLRLFVVESFWHPFTAYEVYFGEVIDYYWFFEVLICDVFMFVI